MKFPDVRWPRIYWFLPILLSLVGSLHRGEAGRYTNRALSNPYFQSRLAAINIVLRAGHPAEAIPLYERAYEQAKTAHDSGYQRAFLSNLGACHFTILNYPEALAAFLPARDLSEAALDYPRIIILDNNISSLYLQMNNLAEARAAVDRGLAVIERTGQFKQRPKLLIQLARVLSRQDVNSAWENPLRQAIGEAADTGDWATVAMGWDFLGDEYRVQRRLPEAEDALTEGFRLRKVLHLTEIESSYRNLARLRFDQGDLHSAGVLLEQALEGLSTSRSLVSTWSVYYERGKVRLGQGRTRAALEDFRAALQFAQDLRLSIVPTDDNRVGSESAMERIYSALIHAGNLLYLETSDTSLARETFAAAEGDRAASLRALISRSEDTAAESSHRKLPARYWDLLPQLQATRRSFLRKPGAELARKMEDLRATLDKIAVASGAGNEAVQSNAMERAQSVLDGDSALLSFHLGEFDCWLWAVTRDRFALYRLAPRNEIAAKIAQFERAVRLGSANAPLLGETLHCMLFGSLEPVFRERQRWLVSLDKDLFRVPFAALVVERRRGEPVYLAQTHEIQITSGAMLLHSKRESWNFSGLFVGIGDPIYNTADPRWEGGKPIKSASLQLARLPGTRHELEACARVWNGRDNRSILLTGRDATKDRLWRQLSDRLSERPAVLHFATHVLEREKSGLIALSLKPSGELEQLGPGEIAPRGVKAKLIVLSGCNSGKGDAPPGTGLMGLTRAWLGGGAEAILATHWATPDDSGPFLVSFYTHLRDAPRDGPAAALRQARLEMLRSGTYRARPEYWAAYFLLGNS